MVQPISILRDRATGDEADTDPLKRKIESGLYIGFHTTMSEIPNVTTDPRDIPLLLEMLPVEMQLLYLKKIPRWQLLMKPKSSKFDIFEPRPLELKHIPFVMYSLTQFAKAERA